METIYVGYVPSDRQVGQALVTALQQSGAHVWDDVAMQHGSDLNQATVFQACHQFIVVLSRAALASPQLRSQVLHYVTLHHWSADFHVTLVVRDQLVTRDLWLFVRHFPRVEQGDLADAALVGQVLQAIATTSPRRRSTRLTTLVQQAGLVQEALITPPRFRRSWAKTWRIQIFAASAILLVLLAFLVSSTLLVKRTIIDGQTAVISSTATPSLTPVPTATVGVQPIFQATSTATPRPSPTVHVTATITATPIVSRSSPTPVVTPIVAPKLTLPVNNTGISDDSNPAPANYDTVGFSYSAQTLRAVGFAAGAPITINGVTFTWPSLGASGGDNVAANGQVISLTREATTLAFLGSSTEGASSGTGTITYADGSTQAFTLEFADWALNGGSEQLFPDNKIVATMPYRNYPSGRQDLTVYVFYTEIALQPGKTIASVTLPTNSGPGLLHVIAMGSK